MIPAILFALDIIMGRVANKTKQLNLKQFAYSRIPTLIQALLASAISGLANGKVTQLIDHYKVRGNYAEGRLHFVILFTLNL